MAKTKYNEEQKKNIEMLKSNLEMYDKTIEEAKLRGADDETINRIVVAKEEVMAKLNSISPSELKKATEKKKNDIVSDILSKNDDEMISYKEYEEKKKAEKKKVIITEEEPMSVKLNNANKLDDFDFSNISTDIQYDIISLPSNGECYKNKMSRIPVSFLTAYDENFITSPNLYKDGLVIDFLLKSKIVDKNIDVDSLVSGDADAIILFLRATSYGSEFPIVVKDPETGKEIEDVVDLTTLKPKEFKLVGDEEGNFSFELPVSKHIVKFKYLTRKEEKQLKIITELETDDAKSIFVKTNLDYLVDAVKTDKYLKGTVKQEYIKNLTKMYEWSDSLKESDKIPFNKSITNRMEMSIVSINGNKDRQFIAKYVRNMLAKDSLMLRRYIIENEPGIDFQIEIQRPKSLGGGSFKTFLEWDDSVFFNIV